MPIQGRWKSSIRVHLRRFLSLGPLPYPDFRFVGPFGRAAPWVRPPAVSGPWSGWKVPVAGPDGLCSCPSPGIVPSRSGISPFTSHKGCSTLALTDALACSTSAAQPSGSRFFRFPSFTATCHRTVNPWFSSCFCTTVYPASAHTWVSWPCRR